MSSSDTRTDGAPRIVPMVVLFVLFIAWSNSFHAISYFRRDLGVSTLATVAMRYGPVAVFCAAWCVARRRAFAAMMARDGWKVALIGALVVPGYNLALNWGQARVPPATASLLITMNPVFTYLLALGVLGERFRWSKLAGLAVSFLGVYLLVSSQSRAFGGGYALWALVVLAAPLSWAVSTVVAKPIAGRSDPLLMTYAATGIGSLPFLALLAGGIGGSHRILATMTGTGWVALVHLVVPCTLLGFAGWFWALRHLPASTVSAFVFLNPPMTSLFGMIWGTEAFHWTTAVFGTITLAGVALSTGLVGLALRGRPASA